MTKFSDKTMALRAVAQDADAEHDAAKAAAKAAEKARCTAFEAYNLSALSDYGVQIDDIVMVSARWGWGNTPVAVVVTGASLRRMGYAVGRQVTNADKVWRGRNAFAFKLTDMEKTDRRLKQ